jgi:CheY-like chemotaxis protein
VAEAASHAKSEFLASMSHELRTPLNAILGFSQLFSLDEQLPQATRDNSRQIERAGQHLLSLVNDMIDLARIESNKLELTLEAVKVKDVVSDSLNMVQSMAGDSGIKIILMQCDVIDITVRADFNRLRQSLINLLTNAIKYNKPQGTVHLACEVVESRVRIAVTDTGQGIPADKQERIFNAFDRLGEERGEVEGTGIGLVITKRIVEAMGGSIGFDSTAGQGSIFWLEFPVAISNERAGSKPAASSSAAGASSHPARTQTNRQAVLYIEDNPMNLRLMQQIFAGKEKWELRGASSAESGMEMIRANLPALILMDINLPGMDGYQALLQLQADPETAHIPVIALSASAMKGDRERGLAAGFVDYLTKPLDIRQLLGLLSKQLD